MQNVRLRPIALPVEHGGWSFLFSPILLGLWIAPSLAGFWLSLAALGAFLLRQPLKLALSDRRRGKRYPRTQWAERFVALYGGATLIAFVAACLRAQQAFWQPFLVAAPLAVVQLYYDARQQSRTLLAEICGASAMATLTAMLALLGGKTLSVALLLCLLLVLQAASALHYVTTRLTLARGQAAQRWPVYVVHLACLLIAVLFWLAQLSNWLPIALFGLLTLRSFIGLLERSLATRTPIVGMQELAFSLTTVVLLRFAEVGL